MQKQGHVLPANYITQSVYNATEIHLQRGNANLAKNGLNQRKSEGRFALFPLYICVNIRIFFFYTFHSVLNRIILTIMSRVHIRVLWYRPYRTYTRILARKRVAPTIFYILDIGFLGGFP